MMDMDWTPPDNWVKIKTIDMHTGGEPLRVVIDGYPVLQGENILQCRREARDRYDHLRKALMWEPRGHFNMYGCIVVPAKSDSADFGVIFTHNDGYSSMCGHGIIAITKLAVESGMVATKAPLSSIKIDTPAGLITSYARVENGRVTSVYFHNVPSYVVATGQQVEVPGLGKVNYDLAFGGAFYAYIDAQAVGLACCADFHAQLIETGRAIKQAIMGTRDIIHPFEEDLSFLYGCIFSEPGQGQGDIRNVCVFADGEIDRSPTGTGVSARAAIEHYNGRLAKGESLFIESITGSCFKVTIHGETKFGDYPAIIPQVEGNAYVTGRHEFLIDPDDPMVEGFILE